MNEMNAKLIETFGRMDNFGQENADVFVTGSPARAAFKVIHDGLAELETQGITRTSAETTKFNKSVERGTLRKSLTGDLEDVAEIARLLAKKNSFYENKFRAPRGSRTDLNLLETVRTWIADGTPVIADFTPYGLSENFFEDLAEDADRFEQVIDEQDTSNRQKVGATASIEELLDEMLDARDELIVIVPRLFRDDAAKISEWTSASRIPKKSKEKDPTSSGS